MMAWFSPCILLVGGGLGLLFWSSGADAAADDEPAHRAPESPPLRDADSVVATASEGLPEADADRAPIAPEHAVRTAAVLSHDLP